jgi:hypothetical protein
MVKNAISAFSSLYPQAFELECASVFEFSLLRFRVL